MKIFNRIIDFIYDVFEYLILFALLAAAILVIIWQYNIMYDESMVQIKSQENSQINISETTEDSLLGEEIEIVIPQGTTVSGIVNILEVSGLVENKEELFQELEELPEEKLPNGKFMIPLGLSTEDLLLELGLQ